MRPNVAINRTIGFRNRLARAVWSIVWLGLYRPSPTFAHGWRRMLLRLFGANVAVGAHPYPTARIWAPWNLSLGEDSCLAPAVDCYCVDKISLGRAATVSQYSYLCSASHDHTSVNFELISGPISIREGAWIGADCFVG